MSKIKFLYICNEYPPLLHGGIGSFMRDIAEAVYNQGHEVIVWGIYATIQEDIFEEINGIKVFRIKGRVDGGRINSLLYRLEFKKKLNLFLQNNKFDIIECQEWLGLLPFGLPHNGFIVRLHGAAIFFDKLLNRKGNRLTHLYEKRMLKNSKNLVAVSDFCGRETLQLCSIPTKKYSVIYNAVDISKLLQFKKERFTHQKIVFANTVSRKKGVFELVKAFNIVADKFPDAVLYIIGKTGYSENGINIKELLTNEVKPEFQKRLFITGWLPSADNVYEQIADAHICVYPSHMEGFGIAPVEPMALGKAVLFMKDGPGAEVIDDNVSGLLINSFSPEDIASKIELLFNSDELVKKLGKEASIRAKKLFDKNTVFVENNLNYYKKLLDAN